MVSWCRRRQAWAWAWWCGFRQAHYVRTLGSEEEAWDPGDSLSFPFPVEEAAALLLAAAPTGSSPSRLLVGEPSSMLTMPLLRRVGEEEGPAARADRSVLLLLLIVDDARARVMRGPRRPVPSAERGAVASKPWLGRLGLTRLWPGGCTCGCDWIDFSPCIPRGPPAC